MKPSVGARLLGFACAVMLLLLPLAGWVIGTAFERSALAGLEARVEAYASSLAGLLEVREGRVAGLSRTPQELRFDQVYSGWYWQVRQQGEVVLTSRSLWDASLDDGTQGPTPRRTLRLQGPRGEDLLGLGLRLQLPGLPVPVDLSLTAPVDGIQPEIAAFRRTLVVALGSLGLMLVAVFALQIRWGLAPLRQMEQDLQAVRHGRSARVDPDLPSDLREVAEVMNEVLAQHEALIQRARSTAGNLAHALKTPLSTMRLRLRQSDADVAGLRQDLAQVRDIVDHHLLRAAAAGRATGHPRHSDLAAAVQPVIDAVRGMSHPRPVRIQVSLPDHVQVAVDAQDLQELAGNLLDNAVKWATARVDLHATVRGTEVLLQVDDDGPGIPEAARLRAVDRGVQLDRHGQGPDRSPGKGSGLGLAIVRDIAALYGIDFRLAQSPSGGLSACLHLPRSASDLPLAG